MRILVCGDVHWSNYSSILRSRGKKYSKRLENLIDSVNWVEKTAIEEHCDRLVYLGDFFDKPNLNSEEITALQDIIFANLPHCFLVGNHEFGNSNGSFNSTYTLSTNDKDIINTPTTTVNTPCCIYDDENKTKLLFLPYILDRDKQPIEIYSPEKYENTIIFSHNDIKDVRLGQYFSKQGFSIDEIKQNCNLFINGHIHNGGEIEPGIINIGNLTGQNFSEDATIYKHQILILDTQTHELKFIDNPYANNFYKLDFTGIDNIETIKDKLKQLNNAVLSIKINIQFEEDIRKYISTLDNIVEYRLITENKLTSIVKDITLNNMDHIQAFIDFIHSNMESNPILEDELSIVTRN